MCTARRLTTIASSVLVAICLIAAVLIAMDRQLPRPANAASSVEPSCGPPADINCDGLVDIRDMQLLATYFGATVGDPDYDEALDLNADGVIDLFEMRFYANGWHVPVNPFSNGIPRLGYAVDPSGGVFLRWEIGHGPYSGTVEILRDPPTAGAKGSGPGNARVIATAGPITDDLTALPLLGSYSSTLFSLYTTTMGANVTNVAEMHEAIESGQNPFAVMVLANQDPGVAQVLGKGYWDADFTTTGIYTYWVRIPRIGRLFGPVSVDTSVVTQLLPPDFLHVFSGTTNVPDQYNRWTRQNMLRTAHASAFLIWGTQVQPSPVDPRWHFGFDVLRRECALDMSTCSGYQRINDLPVLPRVIPTSTLDGSDSPSVKYGDWNTASVEFQLSFFTETTEFNYYWVDPDLNPDKRYCYMVAARDLLGQSGFPSVERCIRPPDFMPPPVPTFVTATTRYHGANNPADIQLVWSHPFTGTADTDHYQIYRATRATARWPVSWTVVVTEPFRPISPGSTETFTAADLGAGKDRGWFFYRIVAVDKRGNVSAPTAPHVGAVDDIYPPAVLGIECQPPLGCDFEKTLPPGTSWVNVYRRYGPNGTPVKIDRVPAPGWPTWSDPFSPTRETEFWYQVRTEDEVGNLSPLSALISDTLSEGKYQPLATPIITGASIVSDGARYVGTIHWSATGGQNVSQFVVYRSSGEERPTSTSGMTAVLTYSLPLRGDVGSTYNISDDLPPGLTAGKTYWYLVESQGIGGQRAASSAYPARYIEGSEPVRLVDSFELSGAVWQPGSNPPGVLVTWDVPVPQCCYIVMRSRSGQDDFSQITPIIPGYSYLDTDVFPGDVYSYQVLRIDGGSVVGSNIDTGSATGEITAASLVSAAAGIPPAAPPPPIDPGAPDPVTTLPVTLPEQLHFGPNWTITVHEYTSGSTLADLSGSGSVQLEVRNGVYTPAYVGFGHIQATAAGTVTLVPPPPSGYAAVDLGVTLPVRRDDRLAYNLSNMQLKPDGAKADVTVVGFGEGLRFRPYGAAPGQLSFSGQGHIDIVTPSLDWEHLVLPPPGGNDCSGFIDAISFIFAVEDWPLWLVPTNGFLLRHDGVTFFDTCTIYRDRYSGLRGGGAIPAALDWRNDMFLNGVYSGTNPIYEAGAGLSGGWYMTGTHGYIAAHPFNFNFEAEDWSFTFDAGRLSGGSTQSGTLTFEYATATDPLTKTIYSGAFESLEILAGGAISGQIQPDTGVNFVAFSLYGDPHVTYQPAALTAGEPAAAWPAVYGEDASGFTAGAGSQTLRSGLNVENQTLTWDVCPEPTDPQSFDFTHSTDRDLDLYVRRGGVSGWVDLTPTTTLTITVAGFQMNFSRFARSWLDNQGFDGGTTARFILPYPAGIEMENGGLDLTGEGCVSGGEVLPTEEILEYWQVGLIPQAAELRDDGSGEYQLWVQGEYEINNLARADGTELDPLLEIEVAFNPDGNFHDSNLYLEDTVYYVDGFYTVLRDLRLSTYDDAAGAEGSEAPAWDEAATILEPPCLPQDSSCGPAGVQGGFVQITGSHYLAWFGQLMDGNASHIYLLGDDDYVGFGERAQAEHNLSDALNIGFAYDLAYAQASPSSTLNSRWIGLAGESSRDLLFTVMTHTLVADPDDELISFGFPAVSTLFIAADEAYASWDENGWADTTIDRIDRFQGWSNKVSLGSETSVIDMKLAAGFYGHGYTPGTTNFTTFLPEIDDEIAAQPGHIAESKVYTLALAIRDDLEAGGVDAATAAQAGARITTPHPLLPQVIDDSPLQIKWIKGAALVEGIVDPATGAVYEGQLDNIYLSALVKVFTREYDGQKGSEPGTGTDPEGEAQKILLEALMELDLDPNGSVYLGAHDVRGDIFDQPISLDADMVVYFGDEWGVEGGLSVYDVEARAMTIDLIEAVGGFTLEGDGSIGLLYVGGSMDFDLELEAIGLINVGGSVLFGRIDPDSPVLVDRYEDLFADMDTSSLAGDAVIQGAYLKLYANNIPLFQFGQGCAGFEIKGGGEIALWLFGQDGTSDLAWGVRLGVNALGEAFCIASLKASVTLQVDNDFGQDNLDLSGDAWIGAGCGACEPEEWLTEDDFWDDKWCIKCLIDVNFTVPLKGSTTEKEIDVSFDCAFL